MIISQQNGNCCETADHNDHFEFLLLILLQSTQLQKRVPRACTRGGNCIPASSRLYRLGVSQAQKAKSQDMSAATRFIAYSSNFPFSYYLLDYTDEGESVHSVLGLLTLS